MFQIINKFQNNLSEIPTFFDERVQKIEIKDENEVLINIFEMEKDDERIRMLPTPSIPLESENHNAGFHCSSLVRKGLYIRLKILVNALDIITEKKRKISVLVFEGLRDLQTQKSLFETCFNEFKEKYQELSYTEIKKLAERYITPPEKEPSHSTGGCVDIRLYDDDKNEFLDMGKFGLCWGANEQAHMFSAGLSDEQKSNRHLLLTAASLAGLMNYPYEWWHFSFGDKYYAFGREEKFAIYKSI
jgi:D-alanyl-D-alanine dipeptidase